MSQPNPAPADESPSAPEFKPYVSPEHAPLELTIRGLVIGSLLGIIFAASSVYLGLKVGLTVSASIPVAVLSITLFRWATKAFGLAPASILENNIVQTTGSAGESIAAGVAFTLPSLLLMGFDMELSRILMVALLGGLIGVLMMIPLRHGLIVKEHGKLTYPEGTACADVLIVGEKGGTSAKTVFQGFFVGLFYAIFNIIAKLWSDTASFAMSFGGALKGSTLAFEVTPPMLGVGYIIGFRTAANMMAGGVLAFMILVPLVHLFGDSMPTVMYPGDRLIRDMNPYQIRNAYILYIGAGAVATGGIIALIRSIPTIASAFMGGIKNLRQGSSTLKVKRTEQDLPMSVVLGGSAFLALAIWLAPLKIGLASALLILLFGFFFVTVSSRITGEIGSSSNPISGMTVATLLITCALFLAMGWTGPTYMAIALTTAAFVCVAASNGGTISQDLKTGFLVGGTPWRQQTAILVGVVTSALVIGITMQVLDKAHTTFQPAGTGTTPVELAEGAPAATGPDGKEYRLHHQRVDIENGLPRGRYLVDGDKTVAFTVVASVDPAYPWKLADASAAVKGKVLPLLERRDFAGAKVELPADAPSREGLDGKSYHVVTLAEAKGDVPAGEYLADAAGVITYSTQPTAEYGLDRVEYRAIDTERDFEGVPEGRYLVDASGAIAYAANENWKFDAPKAQLFRLIIDGVLGGRLPWGLVLAGALLAFMMELVGVSSLPFAVGLYLPISTSAGIFVGGVVRRIVDWKTNSKEAEAEFSPGVLMASGLIAGGAIAGVIQSIIAFNEMESAVNFSRMLGKLAHNESWWPLTPFLGMAALLYYVGTRKPDESPKQPH